VSGHTKYSPAPWNWQGCDLVASDGTTIADTIIDPNDIHKNGEADANARLIASAPELLESLRDFIRETEAYYNGDAAGRPWLKRAFDVIAKAEGKS
jgi:hypothetical protein